jgi:hypothetical protein
MIRDIHPTPTDFTRIRRCMDTTGIGFAGIPGAWWLPATRPFALPRQIARDLAAIGAALFALFDAIGELYSTTAGAAGGLDRLLEYKVPTEIPRLHAPGQVLGVRPDFQLQPLPCYPYYKLVATELEICPSAQGFAHAMQVGYGLTPDLAAGFARVLAGRELLIVCTAEWSEFLFEQLAFCRALAEAGARGRVLCAFPVAELAEHVRRGTCWRPPMFGIRQRTDNWDDNVIERIRAQGLAEFLLPDAPDWPQEVGAALLFRFGYFDCFTQAQLARMREWQARGAAFLNSISFIFDSKAILAGLQLPAVRERIEANAPGGLSTLDRCIPETVLVEPGTLARLKAEREQWVIKYAGFDRGNQAWGGRSLRIGAQHSPSDWAAALAACLDFTWPVVAQRAVPTAHVDIEYFDANSTPHWMRHGATRLRSFFLRDITAPGDRRTLVCGTHLTVSGGTLQVSESTDAVQAPVIFS